MKLSTRMNLGFGLVILLLLLLAGITAWRVERVSDATARMAHEAELLQLADQWQADVRQNSARSLAVGFSDGPAMLDFFKEAMAATSRHTTETQKTFLAQVQDPAARGRAEAVGEVRQSWLAVRDEINALKAAGDADGARRLVQARFIPVTEAYVQAGQGLVDGQVAAVRAARQQVHDMFQQLYLAGALLLGATLAVALHTGLGLSRRIARGFAQARAAAQRIGAGDLSQPLRADQGDEIGELLGALAAMQDRLTAVVARVRQGSQSVADASGEIAQGNHDLSGRTERQAAALQQTVSAMAQLGGTVRHNADNVQQADQLARGASAVAEQGGVVVAQVVETMRGIDGASQRIADIIGVIDGIAFQTNLLALNAAVEAARAGTSGRGFAVVATEVRSLARRSAEAAHEIKALIADNAARVQQGSALAEQAGGTMQAVVASVRRATGLMGGISVASAEQSDGVAQVGQAVAQIDQGTQQNAALVEEMAAAASSLRTQSQALVQAVSVFRLAAPAA